MSQSIVSKLSDYGIESELVFEDGEVTGVRFTIPFDKEWIDVTESIANHLTKWELERVHETLEYIRNNPREFENYDPKEGARWAAHSTI